MVTKTLCMANCLLLSGLSMDRIDGDEERLDEETFVCETNLQAEEGRYRGEEWHEVEKARKTIRCRRWQR